MTMGILIYVLTIALLLVGVYAVVAKKNIIKIIVGVLILDYAVNMLLVLVGYRTYVKDGKVLSGTAPISSATQAGSDLAASAVDPLPQAMVLTSIVIGLGLTALMVAMAMRLYEKYKTFDMNEIRKLRG
jgi:multicomponent Na+:H+ antiporter subunit C